MFVFIESLEKVCFATVNLYKYEQRYFFFQKKDINTKVMRIIGKEQKWNYAQTKEQQQQ